MDKPLAESLPISLKPTSSWRLPLSVADEILVLQVQSGELTPYLGRSYDGRPWESSVDSRSLFSCCPLWCFVELPDIATGGDYELRKVPTSHTASLPTRGSDASIARMLGQATFGPTREEIASLSKSIEESDLQNLATREETAFKQWVRDQIDMPPSLHRAYYRRRTNPRIFKGLVMPTGSSRAACAAGSRWSRFAFDESDRTKEIVATPVSTSGGVMFSLAVKGNVRTAVSADTFGLPVSLGVLNFDEPTRLQICENQPGHGLYLHEWVGGKLRVTNASKNEMKEACKDTASSWVAVNPAVSFPSTLRPKTMQVFSEGEIKLKNVTSSWKPDNDLILESTPEVECIDGLDHIQIGDDKGPIYRRDYRLEMVDNTLAKPAENRPAHATMSGTCPSVPATFVNRKSCVMRPSCAPLTYKSSLFTLNRTTLRAMYERSGKLIYVMEGMRLEATHSKDLCKSKVESACEPCTAKISRWKHEAISGNSQSGCISATTLDANTSATLIAAINASLQNDKNPHVIDVDVKSLTDDGAQCNPAAAFGASVEFEGKCFTHVHPQYLSVCDASYWNEDHNGNSGKFFPIRAFAENGGTSLYYPSSHPMGRWKDAYWFAGGAQQKIWAIGRLDDEIDFANLPVETQDLELAKMFHAVGGSAQSTKYMACVVVLARSPMILFLEENLVFNLFTWTRAQMGNLTIILISIILEGSAPLRRCMPSELVIS